MMHFDSLLLAVRGTVTTPQYPYLGKGSRSLLD